MFSLLLQLEGLSNGSLLLHQWTALGVLRWLPPSGLSYYRFVVSSVTSSGLPGWDMRCRGLGTAFPPIGPLRSRRGPAYNTSGSQVCHPPLLWRPSVSESMHRKPLSLLSPRCLVVNWGSTSTRERGCCVVCCCELFYSYVGIK